MEYDTILNAEKAKELIHRRFESSDLDYKQEFDNSTGAWMEVAKDVYGIANYGGGYIIFGVEDGTFSPMGLDETFHIDSQVWVDKLSKWIPTKIKLSYYEHKMKVNGQNKKFPILYIHQSTGYLIIPKDEGVYQTPQGQTKLAFKRDVIYTRESTSTIAATGEDFWKLFWALLKRTSEETGAKDTPLEVISVLNQKTQPHFIEETLWSNLFPVIELPDYIYSANTNRRDPLEIYENINSAFRDTITKPIQIPSFFLSDKKIYSFSPFDQENPLTICVTSTDSPIPITNWLKDTVGQQKLVKLLNYSLKSLCKKRGFYYDNKRGQGRFFIQYTGGALPEVTWKPYKSQSTRGLISPHFNKANQLSYYEHFGARMRFIILGEGVYLIIEPTRILTEDGINPLDKKSNVKISTKKNVHYKNNNYLYDLKLWLHILAGNRQEIHLGHSSGRVTISILPITSKVSFGILNDQHTGEDFLDLLKSEPLEFQMNYEDTEDYNPLTETSLEE